MTRKRSHSSMAGRPLPSSDISDKSSIKDQQDHFLPTANVSRIMKKSLPANAKISKEAKESVQECVTEFINFITGEASEKCQMEKRKTINGDDLLWAMSTLGFENYLEPLKVYLSKYRETEGEKNSMAMKEDHSAISSSNNSLGDHLSTETTILTPKGKGGHEKSDNLYGEGFSTTQQLFHTNLAARKIHEMDDNTYGAVAANLHQW